VAAGGAIVVERSSVWKRYIEFTSRFIAVLCRRLHTVDLAVVIAHFFMLTFYVSYGCCVLIFSSKYTASYKEWTECAFLHFDGADPEAWKLVCGAVPHSRVPLALMLSRSFAAGAYILFMVIVYTVVISNWALIP
jgi:hypothetical protein